MNFRGFWIGIAIGVGSIAFTIGLGYLTMMLCDSGHSTAALVGFGVFIIIGSGIYGAYKA